MNEKILKIMALALEISPYNENLAYTDKPRITVVYSADFAASLKVTVTRSYKGRSTVTNDVISLRRVDETRLDEIIEWLETVKAEG